MSAAGANWLARFLCPQFALGGAVAGALVGRADTPAADAVCELQLGLDEAGIVDMRFAVYGPPIAVACADWLCETATGRTIGAVRGLSIQDVVQALALAPEQRYGALLALDALADALSQLQA